jgi:hypothetical protein
MTLAERIAARLSGLQTDRYMFGLFGDDRMGEGGFGKLQILGKTKHVTRCQNCGRAGLKHAVVCAVVGDDGHPTNQYYYFGSDCAAKLAGKAEKDVEAEAEHQESSGRPRMKSIKSPKPNEGQMELSLRFAAAWQAHVERYARVKPTQGQGAFDFDALSSAPQATPSSSVGSASVTSEPPALPSKGKQMGLFDQPQATSPAAAIAKKSMDFGRKVEVAPKTRLGHELKQNSRGKWAWFLDGKQKTGAYSTQEQAMKSPEMEAKEYLADAAAQRILEQEHGYAEANDKDFLESHKLWGHLSDSEIQQMIERDTSSAKSLQNEREFNGMGGRRSGPAMANQGAVEAFEVARQAQRYLDERKKRTAGDSDKENHSLSDEARELNERVNRLVERYSEAGELQPGLKGQQDNHPHWETPEFKSWFGQSKAVQPTGKPLRVFHGSKRPDRIGSEFKANRATSGPMSFFTDDPDIASSYATGKQDTSLQMPESYAGWFKYKPRGSRGHVSLDHAWYHLPQEQRQAALERLPHVNQDEDGNISHKHGQGTVAGDWDWYLKREGQGNPIKAARTIWLDSGHLFNNEDRFLEVLKHAGIDTSNFHYESPWHEQPGVHAAWLSIQNPLDTANIPDQVHDALHAAGRLKRGKIGSGADQWDKRHVSGRDWLQRLAEDKQNGTAHAWTSIPDWATKTLKSLGYDGIKDMGGKYGGPKHSVWIPFGPHQIKSAMGNRGTFNSSSKKITYGAGGLVERYSAGGHDERHIAVGKRFGIPPEAVKSALETHPDELAKRDEYMPPSSGRESAVGPTSDHPQHPIGTAKIDLMRHKAGESDDAYVEYLREFNPAELVTSEAEDGVTKSPSFGKYVEWAKAGQQPPPISVFSKPGGKMVSTNRRRVLAAQQAGSKSIVGWHGVDNPETGLPLKYGDLKRAFAEAAKQNSLLDSQGQGLLFSRTGQTQRGLFGDDYEAKPLGKQESDLPKPPEPIKQHKPKPGQQSLFSAVADAMGVSVERYGSTIRHGKYSVTKGDDGLWYHFLHGKNGLQYGSLVGFNSVKEAMRDAVKRAKPPAMRQVAEGPAKGNWEIVPNQPEDKGLPSQPSNSAGKPQEPQDKSMFSAVAGAMGVRVERYTGSDAGKPKQSFFGKAIGGLSKMIESGGDAIDAGVNKLLGSNQGSGSSLTGNKTSVGGGKPVKPAMPKPVASAGIKPPPPPKPITSVAGSVSASTPTGKLAAPPVAIKAPPPPAVKSGRAPLTANPLASATAKAPDPSPLTSKSSSDAVEPIAASHKGGGLRAPKEHGQANRNHADEFVDQINFLHGEAELPAEFRTYFGDSKLESQSQHGITGEKQLKVKSQNGMGLKEGRGYRVMAHNSARDASGKRIDENTNALYYKDNSDFVMTKSGHMLVKGTDPDGRAAYIAEIPPEHVAKYKPKLIAAFNKRRQQTKQMFSAVAGALGASVERFSAEQSLNEQPSAPKYDFSRAILNGMSRKLKSQGFDVRGSGDVKQLLGRGHVFKDGEFTHDAWKNAYHAAAGSVDKRKQTKQNQADVRKLMPNVNWEVVNSLKPTHNHRVAGYIHPKGHLLDLSGGDPTGRTRGEDHRIVGGYEAIEELGAHHGWIRYMPEAGGLELRKQPTPAQVRQIQRLINIHNGQIYLDLHDGIGERNSPEDYERSDRSYRQPRRKWSGEFRPGAKASRILNAIKQFYAGQEPPLTIRDQFASKAAVSRFSAQAGDHQGLLERYAAKQAASLWFLKSRELLKQKMGQHAPASQVLAMLKNNQISPEELEWTGLENHLRSKGNSPVSQQELHDLIGKFGVEESVLGDEVTREKLSKSHRKALQAVENASMVEWNPNDYTLGEYLLNMDRVLRRDAQNGDNSVLPALNAVKMLKKAHGESRWGKYASHSLPGGENYREMLLKLPESKAGIEDWYKTVFVPETKEENPGYEPPSTFAGYDANAKEDLSGMYQRWAKGKGSAGYLSRHWDDPNVLAHIRYKDYVGPDGKKHLHIDEIQSDWHQAGRKQGYGHADKTAGLSREEMGRQYEEHVGYNPIEDDPDMSDDELRELLQGHHEEAGSTHVPNAPFKKNWHMLAMKRMLHHAAANGYDRVTWTPGEEHADRSRLDRHLESIHYNPKSKLLLAYGHDGGGSILNGKVQDGKFYSPNSHPQLHGKNLQEIFGHDIADKIQNSKWPWSGGEHHDYKVVLKGDDLRVNHSGMRKFYDQMLPADTNKLIKRHGGKVGQFDLHLLDHSDDGGFETKPPRTIKVHGFDITPSMKAEATSGKGQSMFSVYEEPGLHIERYEQETPGLQPRFRIGAGEQRLSEQFVKIPSTKPPAIFAILGKAAGMVGKAAVGMKGVAAKAGDKMLGAIQPSADKLADKIGGAAESLDRKGQAAMSKVGLATKPQQAPVKPVTQGVKAGAPVMLSQPHDIHGNGRQLIPQGTQGKYIRPHSEPGHAIVEVNGIQHVIPTKSLTYSAQHTDHKAIEKHKQNQVEQAQKQKLLTARQRAEAVPEGVDSTPQERGLVSSHELQAGDIIEHRTPGLPPHGRVVEVNPKTHEVTIDLALRSPGSPDGIATVGRRMTIPGYDKLAQNGGTVSKQFETSRVPDEARPIGQRKEYQEMLAGAKAIGLNDDAAHEMAMQAWDQSQAKLNPNPKSAPAQVQNAPVQPAAQAASQPKPRHHVSSLQVGDTIRLLSGPESQVNLRYLGPGSRKGFVTVEHPQRGKQEIPVRSAGLRVPGKAKAAKPEQVAAPQEQGSNPDRPRNHVSNLQKGDVLRHLSGDQKGQNVRFVRRSDKPGQVIVNTPERGDHELPATSLGLYSPASLSWYTKAHARNILEQNESMEPRDAIRLARLARGNRRAPQPHQVPRSEFAQYRHGMLAKDKQGNGFLLYGGNRYPLTSAEFDGNKLISDPVKIRERIHLEQIKAIASKDPAAVPSRVRAEYEHQWPKFTGSSAFAKSGGVQPQRSSRKNQPNEGQLNLLPGPSILQPSMEAGRRAQKIINARGVEDEREIDTEIDPNRPQAQIDRREAANRAFMEASAAKFNENRPAGGPAASPPPNQPAAAAPAPPSVRHLTRSFKGAIKQFHDEKQRDLYDYAMNDSKRASMNSKNLKLHEGKLKNLADLHFGGNQDAAHLESLQTLGHVLRHMAGSSQGEHRVIPPLGVEPAKPEPAPAAAPKQKLDTSIKKAIVEARNSDAGGKHRVEHEILRTLPFDASEFDPEVLPQIVQMVKDHIGEFHAPKRMEAEKLASAWSNARARMGIGSDKRKSDARKLIQLMRNGEIDASSKKLKNMDLIAEGLRNDFPNHFSKDPQVRDSQVIDFLASNAPTIPQAHDWDLVKDFWKSLEPGYIEGLRAIAQGAPFNRSEWGNLARHMAPPDDYGDALNTQDFSASGHSFTQRFSAVWSAGVTREKIKDSAAATATSAGIPSRQVQA